MRIAIFLCFILLLTGCQAAPQTEDSTLSSSQESTYSLIEQLDAPERCQLDLTSESGITTIHVDAPIVLPDASSMGVYACSPRPYSLAEVQAVFDMFSGDLSWRDVNAQTAFDGVCSYAEEPLSAYTKYHLFLDTQESYDAGNEYRMLVSGYGLFSDGTLAFCPTLEYKPGLSFTSIQQEGIYSMSSSEWTPLTSENADGCTITLKEAVAIADDAVHHICPDFQLSQAGQTQPSQFTDPNAKFYYLRYTRHIDGIAINDVYQTYPSFQEYDYTAGLEVITVIVADDGICYLDYSNPYDLGECLEENCQLLPFSEILDIYRTVGLLSRQYLEMYEDLQKNHTDIYEIRLGYMSVRQADGSYIYTPVWDFYGRSSLAGTGGYAHASETEDVWGLSLLTIDAVKGTIIDRNYGY